MSIGSDIVDNFRDEVSTVRVDKNASLHGESAVWVKVGLKDGRTVEGTFTNAPRPGFGGVEFASKKDVVALMTAKINSVLDGTSDESE